VIASAGTAVQTINFTIDDASRSPAVAGNDSITASAVARSNIYDAEGNIVDVSFTETPLPNFELKLWDGSRDTQGNPDGVNYNVISAVAVTSVTNLIDQLKAHPKFDSTAVDLQFSNGQMKIVWKIAGQPDPDTTFTGTNIADDADRNLSITVTDTMTVSAGNSYVSTASPPYWRQEFDLSNLQFHRNSTPKNEGNSFEMQIGDRVLTADNVTDVTDLVNKLKSDSDYQFVLKAAGFDPEYDMFDVQDDGPLINPRTQKLTVKFGQYSTDRAFLRQSVNNVTIADPESAITALDYVDQAAKVVNESRARMGATMSRIEYTINNLMNLVENTEEAKSRVLDTDYAKESANLAKAQVLAQAGTAMLAQANQSQQYVLNLLRQG
jgi:flagellin-like hook-associated protein FlgL